MDVPNPTQAEAADQNTALQDTEHVAEEARAERYSVAARQKGRPTVNPAEAQRRLMRDFRSLQRTLSSRGGESMGMTAHPVDADLFLWRAVIAGPEGSAWEGGLFRLEMKFTAEYPVVPPAVKFLTPNMFHPNIYVDGNICLDTLKSCWSPSLDVEGLLLSITSLLSDPNPRSAANCEAARLLLQSRELYEERVRRTVEASLEQSFSDDDDGQTEC